MWREIIIPIVLKNISGQRNNHLIQKNHHNHKDIILETHPSVIYYAGGEFPMQSIVGELMIGYPTRKVHLNEYSL